LSTAEEILKKPRYRRRENLNGWKYFLNGPSYEAQSAEGIISDMLTSRLEHLLQQAEIF
jgi:hypothetical protein